jgi:MFS family permease
MKAGCGMVANDGGILRTSRILLLNRNIRVIAVTGLISGVYIGMLNGILQLFPGALGLSVGVLGILQSLGNRFSGVAASVAQPIAGHYSDVNGRKLVIVLGSVTTVVSMIFFAGAAFTSSVVFVLLGFILFGVSVLGSPSSQALVAESVDMDPRKMNVAYSAIFLLSSIPGAVTPLVAGFVVGAYTYGYLAIFLSAAILESFDLYLYVKELSETHHSLRNPDAERFSFKEALKLPSGSAGYFSALAMDAFAFGITSSIIYAMIRDKFGFTPADIGFLVTVLSLSVIASQYPATGLLLRLGDKRTIALSEALGTILMMGWAVATSLPEFALLSIIFGVSVTTWVPGVQSMLMTHSPTGERGSIGGKVAAFRGLVAFPAPIIGGFLYQNFGYEAPILASIVGTIVCTLMILRYLPSRVSAVAKQAT